MAQQSARTVQGWLELLAMIERERRTYRTKAEIYSRLRNVVKAAGFIAQADESAQELAETRAAAVAEGILSEAITGDAVEAWGLENLDGGPHHIWEWDVEEDLPTSLA